MLARRFRTLEALRGATLEELENVPEIGPVVAASVFAFFQDEENQKLLDDLISVGVAPEPMQAARSIERRSAVFGQDVRPHRHASEPYTSRGRGDHQEAGRQGDGLGLQIDELRPGRGRGGSKLEKARQLKIPVLDEAAFDEMASSGC